MFVTVGVEITGISQVTSEGLERAKVELLPVVMGKTEAFVGIASMGIVLIG